MDFLDVSPKTYIILNTMAAVVVTAIVVRLYLRVTTSREPTVRTGSFTLNAKDFGDDAETHRDTSRNYASGSIYVLLDDLPAVQLLPPQGLTPGVDPKAVGEHLSAFGSALCKLLPDLSISSDVLERLLPMLTVNPALGALSSAGELPMLKHNRFLIRAKSQGGEGGSGGQLHVLAIGYVMPGPPGAPGKGAGAEQVLTVASPNLLAAPASSGSRSYELTFALRQKSCSLLEEELSCDGVTDVPVVQG